MPLLHVNGIELHYHLAGQGTPIVFFHPPCIGSRIFTYLRNDLARDHQTLTFDFRGHGRSATSRTRLTFPLLAEDARQLMDELDISSAYICTYSMASMVAIEALLAYPDRFRGAILLSGLSEAADAWTRTKLKTSLLAGALRIKDAASLPLIWFNADNTEAFHQLRAETIAGDVTKWIEYIRCGLQYKGTDRLSGIRQPVLLLCGEQDAVFRRYARQMQQRLPDASSALIPGVKHALPTHGANASGPLIRRWIAIREGAPATRGEEERAEAAYAGEQAQVQEREEQGGQTTH